MEQSVSRERNYGIDLLRIISMYLVVLLHFLGSADIEAYLPLCSLKYEVAWSMELLAFCAVNCYALISGYVSVNRKQGLSNLIVLWFEVLFYSVLINAIFWIAYPDMMTAEKFVASLFPLLTRQYWYFTAYFGLRLIMPVLQYILEHMEKADLKRIAVIGFVLLSFLPALVNQDIFHTNDGYSMLWLCYLFIVGGYIRKYNPFENVSSKKLIMILGGTIILPLGIKFVIEYISWNYLETLTYSTFLTKYTSPNVVIEAVVMLAIFSRINVTEFWRKAIALIAPASFGVYLIHSNTLVLEKFMFGKLEIFSQFSVMGMIGSIVLVAMGVFWLCILVDLVRIKIFELCKVKKLADAIDKKLENAKIFG